MLVPMSIEIKAPPEVVWSHIANPEKCLRWLSTIQRFEWTGEREGGEGATCYCEEEIGGRIYGYHLEITEWQPGRVVSFRMPDRESLKCYEGHWTIEETAQGCRFVMTNRVEFPWGPFGRLIGWFADRDARKERAENLRQLKHNAEAEWAERADQEKPEAVA